MHIHSNEKRLKVCNLVSETMRMLHAMRQKLKADS